MIEKSVMPATAPIGSDMANEQHKKQVLYVRLDLASDHLELASRYIKQGTTRKLSTQKITRQAITVQIVSLDEAYVLLDTT